MDKNPIKWFNNFMSSVRPNILVINDGNRRWAKEHNLSIREGYREMVKKIAFLCDDLKDKGFEKVYVTFCSVSNLARPKEEVDIFYDEYLATPDFSKNKIKIELHGNLDLIPEHFKGKCELLIRNTAKNRDFTLHYMVNWSIDDEILRIFNRLQTSHARITKETLKENSDIKDPVDLIIRTGNRKRLSSCIPLNSPFAEIYFLDILFPEINSQHIGDALNFYHNQIRTYGT